MVGEDRLRIVVQSHARAIPRHNLTDELLHGCEGFWIVDDDLSHVWREVVPYNSGREIVVFVEERGRFRCLVGVKDTLPQFKL